jgi:hypothetical protein
MPLSMVLTQGGCFFDFLRSSKVKNPMAKIVDNEGAFSLVTESRLLLSLKNGKEPPDTQGGSGAPSHEKKVTSIILFG